MCELILERHPNFSHVHGISDNGKVLADLLSSHITTGNILIVDDVLNITTMQSTRLWFRTRQKYVYEDVFGYVIFACVPCPSWVRSLWQLEVRTNEWEHND
jgi:hypothetical protein